MGEIVKNVDRFPEGLDILAEKMDLPFPKEDMASRRAAVMMLIGSAMSL